MTQVRLLGPIEVASADGTVTAVPGLRRRAVLAVLGLNPGRTVSIDQLIDVVWDAEPPATATNTLQRNISYLRDLLGSKNAIVAKPPGYLLRTADLSTDVEEAERLICQGRQAASPQEAVTHLDAALALWRGPALADVAELRWLGEQAQRLGQTQFEAIRTLVDARLALGEHAQLVPELEQLVAARPFDEDLHRQLMLALYRAGRQAESLARYQRLKRTLADELGIDPGQGLRDLEASILRQDSALDAPSQPLIVAPTVRVPAQLPLATAAFAARRDELKRLDEVMARRTENVCIAIVSGTAGVGKTTLAVHWAHSARHGFPDGQLYADLRGFDRSGSVTEPATVLRAFLDAFGVPLEKIPAEIDALAALYRSVLADKRILVVLDNARDAEQVRPLLPGTPGCAVAVTSRYQLTALVTVEGAQPVILEPLTDDEARDLLTRRIGKDRVAAEEAAIQEIITCCARLPLALALAAASCVTRPHLPVRGVAAELRKSFGTLDALRNLDSGTDIRSIFSWSYHALSPAAARVFRLLGQHPGPDFTVAAAASLTALPAADVQQKLAELVRANLLTESSPERYGLHDLLWTYAADLGRDEDGFPRLLDHYLHTAMSAALLLNPQREPPVVPPPGPDATPERLSSREEAASWLTAERAVLLGLIKRAAALEYHEYVWRLAWATLDHLDRGGHWGDQVANQQAAIESAKCLGARAAQANAHFYLATAYARMARYDAAQTQLAQAFDLYASLGDLGDQAKVQYQMGWLSNRQGEHQQAVGHARQALRLYRLAGQSMMAARALNSLGWAYALGGDFARARPRCELALTRMRELGDLTFQAGTSDSLGYIYHHLGDHDLAIEHFQRALELFRELDDRYYEADTLKHLGDTYHATGDDGAAQVAWKQALEILELLRHPDSAKVRARLRTSADRSR
ncbi:DNA-binding SARP family transcriptional activator [Hamadaea flava]|uniref:BTAD domain-containing putative transcriptional regulator n=1 Tax=Hamadaea flava TaxID=1742688 RepID=A0ABV8LMY3_9ACTN|nr:BTAD domain-containing putative transcriptional regulator [Hamadaea flava]MCP2329583.1 DNA-binding SARP family transcriptional activator [Hamadaea flava]